jgi:hypothetical protein
MEFLETASSIAYVMLMIMMMIKMMICLQENAD